MLITASIAGPGGWCGGGRLAWCSHDRHHHTQTPLARDVIAGHRLSAPMFSEARPCRSEHVENGNGTVLALVWFGGNTRRPAALTGRRTDLGKSPVSTIPRTAVAVFPLVIVTRCSAGFWKTALRPT